MLLPSDPYQPQALALTAAPEQGRVGCKGDFLLPPAPSAIWYHVKSSQILGSGPMISARTYAIRLHKSIVSHHTQTVHNEPFGPLYSQFIHCYNLHNCNNLVADSFMELLGIIGKKYLEIHHDLF